MSAPTSSETRLGRRLAERLETGRLLVPYLTAGFPTADATPAIMEAIARAGADVIELGVPFSDPLADGPTIQGSSQVSLEGGGSLTGTLEALRAFRGRDRETPVVVFTYLNPVFRHGVDAFLDEAMEAGADGVLLTDLPLGEDRQLEARFEDSPLALVRLIAPTTPRDRAREIAARAQGFLYYISRTGVTGARAELRAELEDEVRELEEAASVPVVVGFGISSPEQAARVGRVADGVVVGSALIEAIREGGAEAAERFVKGLREALDEG
ncbi:MAG: tryptophan synthase subunit alpha [Longimicrobiales bacterium]|nr:tryptophan synthase subunit alpha [Longimicrobiales bacterium]